MLESKFMKEFFIISNIHRTMSNLLKEKLLQNNLPLTETQIMILFLMNNKDKNIITSQDILEMGHFSTSNLLFSMNSLNNNNYVHVQHNKKKLGYDMHSPVDLSNNGLEMLQKIDKICSNLSYKSQENIVNLLSEYQTSIEEAISKSKKYII